MRNILALPIFLLMTCIVVKPVSKSKQGICGTILLKQGNRMPGSGRVLSAGQPVIREIDIYKLTNLREAKNINGLFYAIKTALVAKTGSNAKGYFEIALPAGEYSVFVVEKDGLYANNFDGKGSINAVKVIKDSLARKDIVINYQASF